MFLQVVGWFAIFAWKGIESQHFRNITIFACSGKPKKEDILGLVQFLLSPRITKTHKGPVLSGNGHFRSKHFRWNIHYFALQRRPQRRNPLPWKMATSAPPEERKTSVLQSISSVACSLVPHPTLCQTAPSVGVVSGVNDATGPQWLNDPFGNCPNATVWSQNHETTSSKAFLLKSSPFYRLFCGCGGGEPWLESFRRKIINRRTWLATKKPRQLNRSARQYIRWATCKVRLMVSCCDVCLSGCLSVPRYPYPPPPKI